jgi:hypothetical protein
MNMPFNVNKKQFFKINSSGPRAEGVAIILNKEHGCSLQPILEDLHDSNIVIAMLHFRIKNDKMPKRIIIVSYYANPNYQKKKVCDKKLNLIMKNIN